MPTNDLNLYFLVQHEPRVVQLLSHPFLGHLVLNAGPAQFGSELKNTAGVNLKHFEKMSLEALDLCCRLKGVWSKWSLTMAVHQWLMPMN
jgi:hypothetical protein